MGLRYVVAATFPMRLRGLIGRERDRAWSQARILFAPCKSVHTFFMHSPVDVAFADERGTVVEVRARVPPMRIVANRRACMVVERLTPSENSQADWLCEGDVLPVALLPKEP